MCLEATADRVYCILPLYSSSLHVTLCLLHASASNSPTCCVVFSFCVQLSVYLALFQLSLDIVPLTTIPMDRTSCPPPDSCKVWDTIADDLDTLAQEHFGGLATVDDVCNRYDNCSGVACSLNVTLGRTTTYHVNMEVIPCRNPPAVHLLFADNSGVKYYDHNFDKSAVDSFSVPAFNVPVTLHVTVNQVPGAVAFAVSLYVAIRFCINMCGSMVLLSI